ncbi:hypothetical protein DFP72DRAFT_846350 [Ephemerocybe angulata]|uniref:Uncharacterized protein n=1 Tax=Ephemerocybe angulata TaxID=980116 RepID=A0A8H6I3W1_9AGAR|nr:hypothetical protein DFP72DRAFT_846350 [Tulosesus angulatus]
MPGSQALCRLNRRRCTYCMKAYSSISAYFLRLEANYIGTSVAQSRRFLTTVRIWGKDEGGTLTRLILTTALINGRLFWFARQKSVAGLEDTVRGRYSRLQGVSGLPLEAAAAAFSLSRPDTALEWLEQGRCLVWSQLSDLRTPFGSLHSVNEAPAKSIADVAKKLENAGSTRISSHTGMSFLEKILIENEGRTHLSLARQWHELSVPSARAIPGFESFLQPSPCSALMQHLPDGPVVVINVSKALCDAIVLVPGRDEPLHVPFLISPFPMIPSCACSRVRGNNRFCIAYTAC